MRVLMLATLLLALAAPVAVAPSAAAWEPGEPLCYKFVCVDTDKIEEQLDCILYWPSPCNPPP